MEKKILIAVDGSDACHHAVDYVGLMEGAMVKNLRVTLFYVMSAIPPFLRREAQTNRETLRQVHAMEKKNREAAHAALEAARQRLLDHGFRKDHLEQKPQPRTADVAKDIIFEGERGMYDAVVLGRRGVSKAQELFVGSVTNQVVQHANRTPIWIVGSRVSSLKVLCAVDGSEGSLKAVDHMAFMLGDNPECKITLFHAGASLASYCPLDFGEELKKEIEGELMRSEERCMDDFYSRAVKVLNEAGLSRDQIETKTKQGGLSVSRAILDEMRRGDYGTVVLGRRGENEASFLGHTSDKIMRGASEAAVWIVG